MLLHQNYIPEAIQKNDTKMIECLSILQSIYAKAIAYQLRQLDSIYVLVDKKTHNVLVRESSNDPKKYIYVAYSDLYKYQSSCLYKQVASLDAARKICKQYGGDGIVVTDGPTTTAIVNWKDID